MGRKEEICGAVASGILVLGMRHGKGSEDDQAAMELTYLKTRELMDRFSRRHGAYVCRKLLNGCDLMTEDGQKYFQENDLLKKTCMPCIDSVIEILESIL